MLLHHHHHLYKTYIGIASFGNDLAPQLGCLFASIVMHNTLLRGMLRAPQIFFDCTPSGRILSRFSKDIDVIDSDLPRQISDTIYCVFEVNKKNSKLIKSCGAGLIIYASCIFLCICQYFSKHHFICKI